MLDGLPAVFRLFGVSGHLLLPLSDTLKKPPMRSRGIELRDRHKEAYVKSPEFLFDIGLMYDTLHELSIVSEELIAQNMILLRADLLVNRAIWVLTSFKTQPGAKLSDALEAKDRGTFKDVHLKSNPKI